MSLNKKIVLFDYDDTLMQTRICKFQALMYISKKRYNKDLTESEIEKTWGVSHKNLFMNLFGIDEKEASQVMRLYEDLDKKFPIIPYEDAFYALKKIQKQYKIAIISSCTKSLIKKQLMQTELKNINFHDILGSENTLYHKPSGKVFDVFFEKNKMINRENVFYIGDGVKDERAAHDAQIDFLGIDRSKMETKKMKANGAIVYSSLSEIANHLCEKK